VERNTGFRRAKGASKPACGASTGNSIACSCFSFGAEPAARSVPGNIVKWYGSSTDIRGRAKKSAPRRRFLGGSEPRFRDLCRTALRLVFWETGTRTPVHPYIFSDTSHQERPLAFAAGRLKPVLTAGILCNCVESEPKNGGCIAPSLTRHSAFFFRDFVYHLRSSRP